MSRKEYMSLLRASDAQIAGLLDRGYAFVTNAFRPGQAPPGLAVKDCDQVAAQLRGEGWEVETASAYDERGQALPRMAALWRRRPNR
jgi:hypothetical protein